MANFTVTYSEKAKGFPSFYSFVPENMIGMNNRFFSISNGELYLHNSDEVTRNNFYEEQYNSNIDVVVNDKPFDNKIFKTVNLEGTHPWNVNLVSDIQNTGNIDRDWFEEKEGSHRAFVRNTGGDPIGTEDLPLRSMNGIGRASAFFTGATSAQIDYPIATRLNAVSIGDTLYYAESTDNFTAINKWGTVTGFSENVAAGTRRISVDTVGNAHPTSVQPMVLAAKNAIAESHGVLGHHGTFSLSNNATEAVELIALETEVMISKA